MSDKTGNNEQNEHSARRIIRSLKAKQDSKRSIAQQLADFLTEKLGSMAFLIVNLVFFAVWISINLELIPGLKAFDPFPFGLLTMIVSLEAIFLSVVVLISQNRAEQVGQLEDEVDLQVDIITERELTKIMHMLSLLMKKSGIDISKDENLREMLKPINVSEIEQKLEKQVIEKK